MTAEEFMNQEKYEPDSGISFSDYHGDIAEATESLMVDFARHHVQRAQESFLNELQKYISAGFHPLDKPKLPHEWYPSTNIV